MIKKLLVPTDGSAHAQAGVDYAVSLAKQHGAQLHGLYVVDVRLLEGPFLRDLSASLGTAPFVNYQNNVSLILEERGKAALGAFARASEQAGLHYETTMMTGQVAGSIVEQGELVDLIVMGRSGEHADWLDGVLGSTTEGVVRRAKCPVLVTDWSEARIGQVVVAYDGSSHAKQALHLAAVLGESWGGRYAVLSVSDDHAAHWLEGARSYMEAHTIEVEYVGRDGDPREEILEFCRERNADLLLMGGYGHSKVREMLLGSTTAHLINRADCPVLLTR